MKTTVMKIVIGVETLVIMFLIFLYLITHFYELSLKDTTELFREKSPQGECVLVISQMGSPFLFGPNHVRVTIYRDGPELLHRSASFDTDISDDGGPGWFDVKWLEDGVQVTLCGSEQKDAVYILPFPELEEME